MTITEKIILAAIIIGNALLFYGCITLIEWDLDRRRKGVRPFIYKCMKCGKEETDYHKDDICDHLTYTETK